MCFTGMFFINRNQQKVSMNYQIECKNSSFRCQNFGS